MYISGFIRMQVFASNVQQLRFCTLDERSVCREKRQRLQIEDEETVELSQMQSGKMMQPCCKTCMRESFCNTKNPCGSRSFHFPLTGNGNSIGIFFSMTYAVHNCQYLVVDGVLIAKSKLQKMCTCQLVSLAVDKTTIIQGCILVPCPQGHGQGVFSVHTNIEVRFQSNVTFLCSKIK